MSARPRVRQLGLGELLDESFRMYRNGFVTFVAVAALFYVPYALLNFAVMLPFNSHMRNFQRFSAPSAAAPPDLSGILELFSGMVYWGLGVAGISMLYSLVFDPLLQGALARGVAQQYHGQPLSVGDSFGTTLRRAWPLIGARLLVALFGSPLILIGFGIYVAAIFAFFRSALQLDSGDASPAAALGPLFMMLLSLGFLLAGLLLLLFIGTRLLFTAQAAVLETQGAWASVQRSWRLTRGFFWRTLGYLLVIGLLTAVISGLPAALLTFAVQFFFPDQVALQTMVTTAVSSVSAVVVIPYSMIAYTLLYYDLRVRKEAFDLEQRAGNTLPPAPGYGLPGAL